MEMENQEKAASSARLSVIQEVPEDSTPKSFEQPIVSRTTSMSSFVPTNITSEQEKFNSDFATIMGSFLEKGMDITQARKQTVKSIRDMQTLTKSFTGQEESLMSAASKIVRGESGLPNMTTGRPLSVIPESIAPTSISVSGGKRRKRKKQKNIKKREEKGKLD